MSTPEVNIYQDQYKDKIINLILDIQIGEFGIPITIKDQPDLNNIPSFYQKGAGNFWVARSGDKIIGTIALIDIGNSQCVLRKMFVAKEYRGKDKGIAQELLTTLLNWCKSKNIKEIYLGTVATYFAAHRFYEKNAFTEIPKTTLPANFPIMKVDTKFYKYVM
ncbi:MAG: GNAT family N-acetyltransferase [Pseudomonadota bacterium]